jgi:hypothetical protein
VRSPCQSTLTKVRGIQVCGRSVYYRHGRGLKCGYQGTVVPVDQFVNDLNITLAQAIRDAVKSIEDHHARKQVDESIDIREVLDTLPDTLKPDTVVLDDDDDIDLSIPGGN